MTLENLEIIREESKSNSDSNKLPLYKIKNANIWTNNTPYVYGVQIRMY